MVQALINISEHTNHILNIIKAKYQLQDKSAAINIMAKRYEQSILEPELRPEYVEQALRIQQQPAVKVGTVEQLRKRFEK
jgi:hypothetical protein